MSNIFEGLFDMNTSSRAACRVAYTLNNTQPVVCTIIGDQPYFYMDADVSDEEFSDLDDYDLRIMQQELETLKREIEVYDRFTDHYSDVAEEKTEHTNFIENSAGITQEASSNKPCDIQDIKDILSQSRTAQAYLDHAQTHNATITYSKQVEQSEYKPETHTILVNPECSHAEQVVLCAKELRRLWLTTNNALVNPKSFNPDDAILVNRIQIADEAVTMVRVAWELQLSGYRDAWERIESSSMGDLGRALAREAFIDFRTLNNGRANSAVFEAWFLSERCKSSDNDLITTFLAEQGQDNVKIEDLEQKSLTPDIIAAIGAMPFGKNYLAEHVYIIMDDEIFTTVRDRSNANFLWFIKFERSFRETEHYLQDSGTLINDGDLSSSPTQQSARNHDLQNTDNVVQMFSQTAIIDGEAEQYDNAKPKHRRFESDALGNGRGSGAQIIDLHSKI